ncbi:MAG: MMPL family transporter [Streptomyces sp.]|nr:MMPL family transporter [Streptomyces sp.]
MLDRLARAIVRRPRAFLIAVLGFMLIAGPLGGPVVGKLVNGGFEDPKSESSLAKQALDQHFGVKDSNLVLLVRAPGSVDSGTAAEDGAALTRRLAAEPGISQVGSYWSQGRDQRLRSEDSRYAMVIGHIGGGENAAADRVEGLRKEFAGRQGSLEVKLGGSTAMGFDTDHTVQKDLQRMEAIAFPVLFVILLLVFGSLVSALLPLLMVLPLLLGTLLMLRTITLFTDVSVFALNVTTIIGLGIAIDYSLFIVTRYREEIRDRGGDLTDKQVRSEAIVAAVRTAGRTVVFSAVTVMLSMAALALFPLLFLRSIAVAGIGVMLFAALAATIVMPMLLALFGSKIDSLDLRKGVRRLFGRPPRPRAELERGVWHRLATFVMRFAAPVAVVATAALLLLGAPFLGAKYSLPDDRQLPKTAQSRQVGDIIREDFVSREADVIAIVATGIGDPKQQSAAIGAYAERISKLDGVESVASSAGVFAHGARVAPAGPATASLAAKSATYLRVSPDVEPFSAAGERLVHDIRGADSPWPVRVAGGGPALVDTLDALGDRMPMVLGFMVLSTFVLLFLFTGSLLLPLKALVLNALSLSATFGAVVWIFQEGHLAGALDATVTGSLIALTPILMFCLMFGLSMDYEVFMLSRIKEEYERTGDNTAAVARGLELTGRLVTAAALLLGMVMVVSLFTAQITFQKMLGLGLTVALVVDTLVVRGLLLPAFMRLAGSANWWAPGPLRRVHRRFGLSEAPKRTGHGHPAKAPSAAKEPDVPATAGS